MISIAIGCAFFVAAFGALIANALGAIADSTYYGFAAVLNGAVFLMLIFDGQPGWAALSGIAAAINAYMWWRNRRKGKWKRAARELGAKSKARVEALARQMTPSPIPSPAGAS